MKISSKDVLLYNGFIEPSIMIEENILFDTSGFLRVVANNKNWISAETIGGREGYRHNKQLNVSSISHRTPELKFYDDILFRVFNAALSKYKNSNQHLTTKSDEGYFLLRYDAGDHYVEHCDGTAVPRVASAILYLNEDYEGGELEFPRHGIFIKPSKNSLVMFPSNFAFPHIAHPVKKGTKYCVVTWFRGGL